MLEKNPKSHSANDVECALAKVHSNRHARAKNLVQQAHQLQMILTGRSPVSEIVIKYLMPLLRDDGFLNTAVPICKASHRVYRLPVPKRHRLVPFDDELPAKPLNNQLASRMAWVLTSGSMAVLLYYSGASTHLYTLIDGLKAWSTGSSSLSMLAGLSSLSGVGSTGSLVQNMQLRTNLLSTLAIWLVEGHRVGNRLSVLLWYTYPC